LAALFARLCCAPAACSRSRSRRRVMAPAECRCAQADRGAIQLLTYETSHAARVPPDSELVVAPCRDSKCVIPPAKMLVEIGDPSDGYPIAEHLATDGDVTASQWDPDAARVVGFRGSHDEHVPQGLRTVADGTGQRRVYAGPDRDASAIGRGHRRACAAWQSQAPIVPRRLPPLGRPATVHHRRDSLVPDFASQESTGAEYAAPTSANSGSKRRARDARQQVGALTRVAEDSCIRGMGRLALYRSVGIRSELMSLTHGL
jgi:hypothetical protein